MIPTVQENPTGLHRRYNVTKVNGDVVDEDAVYLVLRLDKGGDDADWTAFCRSGARGVALDILQSDVPRLQQMAKELYSLCEQLERG